MIKEMVVGFLKDADPEFMSFVFAGANRELFVAKFDKKRTVPSSGGVVSKGDRAVNITWKEALELAPEPVKEKWLNKILEKFLGDGSPVDTAKAITGFTSFDAAMVNEEFMHETFFKSFDTLMDVVLNILFSDDIAQADKGSKMSTAIDQFKSRLIAGLSDASVAEKVMKEATKRMNAKTEVVRLNTKPLIEYLDVVDRSLTEIRKSISPGGSPGSEDTTMADTTKEILEKIQADLTAFGTRLTGLETAKNKNDDVPADDKPAGDAPAGDAPAGDAPAPDAAAVAATEAAEKEKSDLNATLKTIQESVTAIGGRLEKIEAQPISTPAGDAPVDDLPADDTPAGNKPALTVKGQKVGMYDGAIPITASPARTFQTIRLGGGRE